MHVYVCMYITHTMDVCIHCLYVYAYMRMYMCIHVYIYTCTHAYMCYYVYMHRYARVCTVHHICTHMPLQYYAKRLYMPLFGTLARDRSYGSNATVVANLLDAKIKTREAATQNTWPSAHGWYSLNEKISLKHEINGSVLRAIKVHS